MDRYVISAPRSGLNWVRFCVEHFYGIRTPGHDVLIKKTDDFVPVFQRSHDVLGNRRDQHRTERSWSRFAPEDRGNDKSLIILRDPAALFVRAYRRDLRQFYGFIGNVQYIARCAGPVHVAYYEDLVASPDAMWAALEFLDFPLGDGMARPTRDDLHAQWSVLGGKSRGIYDVNQGESGGSTTKTNPTDFKFHQRRLTDKGYALVWGALEQELKPEELSLLERYRPSTRLPSLSSTQSALLRGQYWLGRKWKKITKKN